MKKGGSKSTDVDEDDSIIMLEAEHDSLVDAEKNALARLDEITDLLEQMTASQLSDARSAGAVYTQVAALQAEAARLAADRRNLAERIEQKQHEIRLRKEKFWHVDPSRVPLSPEQRQLVMKRFGTMTSAGAKAMSASLKKFNASKMEMEKRRLYEEKKREVTSKKSGSGSGAGPAVPQPSAAGAGMWPGAGSAGAGSASGAASGYVSSSDSDSDSASETDSDVEDDTWKRAPENMLVGYEGLYFPGIIVPRAIKPLDADKFELFVLDAVPAKGGPIEDPNVLRQAVQKILQEYRSRRYQDLTPAFDELVTLGLIGRAMARIAFRKNITSATEIMRFIGRRLEKVGFFDLLYHATQPHGTSDGDFLKSLITALNTLALRTFSRGEVSTAFRSDIPSEQRIVDLYDDVVTADDDERVKKRRRKGE
jgi:cytochrome c556